MSTPTPLSMSRHLDRLVLASRQQVALRAVPLLATPAFVWVTVVLGAPFHPVLTGALLLLAVGAALLPDSSVPLFLLLGLAGLWATQVDRPLSWWTLMATGLLLAVHLACTLGSLGPPALRLDRGALRRWGPRATLMAAVPVLVWAAAVLLEGLALPAGPVPVVTGLALVLAWTGFLGRRLITRDGAD